MRARALLLLLVFGMVVAGISGCRSCETAMQTCAQCLPDPGTSSQCALQVPEPPPELPSYDNLVFSGGGVKGAAYGGALEVLDRYDLLAPAGRVAGNSAGSITALAVSLGLSGEEICRLVTSIDYTRFEDPASLPCHLESLEKQYGWYTGDYALCFLECLVERYTGSRQTTFAELHSLMEQQRREGHCEHPGPTAGQRCFKDLSVIGTDVNRHQIKVFSRDTTPDVAIAEAVRISMAIPYFFTARQLDGSTMVDGGVLWNYPISLFDEPLPGALSFGDRKSINEQTLGFHLGLIEFDVHPVTNIVELSMQLFSTFLDAQIAMLAERPDDIRRTVFIDTGDICATDFDLTPEQVRWLVEQGAAATAQYFKQEKRATRLPDWLLERLQALQ